MGNQSHNFENCHRQSLLKKSDRQPIDEVERFSVLHETWESEIFGKFLEL